MNIEIVNGEDFASVKKVVMSEGPEKSVFETPAPAYVPFLEQPPTGKGDEKRIHGDYGKILPFFPIANISSDPTFPMGEVEFKLYLAREGSGPDHQPDNGSPTESVVVCIFSRDDGFNYPPLLQGEERGNGLISFEQKISDGNGSGSRVVAVGNLSSELSNPRRLLVLLHGFRERYAWNDLLYAPGVADPFNVPYLSYLGFDLFDTVKAARDAVLSRYWGYLGSLSVEKIGKNELALCGCSGCEGLSELMGSGDPSLMGDTEKMVTEVQTELARYLYLHNSLRLAGAVWETRKAIENECLYKHAHGYAVKDPVAAAVLRLLYTDNSLELIGMSPRVSERTLVIAQREMLDHPDVTGYGGRLKETYVPPEREILMLLPCSYKKPYSLSKTHKRIVTVVRASGLFSRIHRVVITSPLGAVPIELDSTYPASNYDIPVTGDWDEKERGRVEILLEMLLEKGNYEYVVSHLGDENFLVRDILEKRFTDVRFIEGRPTSEEALDELCDVLGTIKKQMDDSGRVRGATAKRQGTPFFRGSDVWGQLTFQFDEDIAERLTKNSRLTGRWPAYSIKDVSTGDQIARFVPRRGMFSLGSGAGSRLEGIVKNRVFIEDFHPKGTIFCVGIVGADSNIRPMDEVLIYHGEELRGIGRSLVNGKAMTERARGAGVKVRHRL